jgi:hypothetical protein
MRIVIDYFDVRQFIYTRREQLSVKLSNKKFASWYPGAGLLSKERE